MKDLDFDDFFRRAAAIQTGPFDYQRRLACGEKGELAVTRAWKSHDWEALNRLLDFGVVLRPCGSKGVNPVKTAKPSKPFVDAD
jgi:hypothetical protein